LLLELLRLLAHQFVKTPALHLRVEHFQGSAAGVDLVVMGEIGEAFEDTEQLLVTWRSRLARSSTETSCSS
jgi:hypothetical protein